MNRMIAIIMVFIYHYAQCVFLIICIVMFIVIIIVTVISILFITCSTCSRFDDNHDWLPRCWSVLVLYKTIQFINIWRREGEQVNNRLLIQCTSNKHWLAYACHHTHTHTHTPAHRCLVCNIIINSDLTTHAIKSATLILTSSGSTGLKTCRPGFSSVTGKLSTNFSSGNSTTWKYLSGASSVWVGGELLGGSWGVIS